MTEIWILTKIIKNGYGVETEVCGAFSSPEKAFSPGENWVKINDNFYELEVDPWVTHWELGRWVVDLECGDLSKENDLPSEN